MARSNEQPIIVKRIKKGGHGHHGGAWKVAYADFVTAMMAFFLLLWLLNSVSEEQLIGISNYFAPSVSTSPSSPGAGHILGGATITSTEVFRDPPQTDATEARTLESGNGDSEIEGDNDGGGVADITGAPAEMSEGDLDALIAEREEAQFQAAIDQLHEAIESSPELRDLASSLIVANTPEGLHIQIVDQEGLPMFPRGSAEMYPHTRALLQLIAGVTAKMPQQLAITGHTDATPFANDGGYSNWELSADRANAARRALIAVGVPESRFSRVVGKAATEPLVTEDPAAPANPRLSVVLLRGTGDQATPEEDQAQSGSGGRPSR